MNMDNNKSSILGCLLVQRKSRLDTVTKAPNSMSCKMATVLKKKQENIFDFYFCSVLVCRDV